MNNIIHIPNTQNDLCYISLNFSQLGRVFKDYNSIAADFLLSEGINDNFYKNLEKKAIELYFNTGYFDFGIDVVCLKKELKYALLKLNELINNPDYSKLDLIKKKIKNTYLATIEDYDEIAKMRLLENYFGSCFSNDKFADFNKINKDELINFFQDLKNTNVSIVASANLTQSDLDLLKTFANEKQVINKHFNANNNFNLHSKEKISQAYIRFCSNANSNSIKEKVALSLCAFVLGGGFGSRLTEEIRVKRGLAYTAYNSFVSYKNNDIFMGLLQTKNESELEAIKIVKDEFYNVFTKGIKENEFIKAKEFLIGYETLKYSTLQKRHNIICQEIFNNYEIGEYKNRTSILKELSLDEINSIIKRFDSIANNINFYTVSANER